MDYEKLCLQVCDIARNAGQYIAQQRRTFTSDKIEVKGSQNFVSYVDKAAEMMIVESLTPLVAGASFIAEEGSGVADVAGTTPYRWIIDPLDGTTNFIHGMPPYAVSIALVEGDEVVVGVVYEITVKECFWAWKGSLAYLNGAQITVSDTRDIADSLIVTGLAYDSAGSMASFLHGFEYFNRHSHGARRLGSAATDLVYVAAGRCEGFYQVNLSPWDVAAGALIVQQAGGIVRDRDGGGDYIFGRSIIATNAHMWDKIQEVANV